MAESVDRVESDGSKKLKWGYYNRYLHEGSGDKIPRTSKHRLKKAKLLEESSNVDSSATDNVNHLLSASTSHLYDVDDDYCLTSNSTQEDLNSQEETTSYEDQTVQELPFAKLSPNKEDNSTNANVSAAEDEENNKEMQDRYLVLKEEDPALYDKESDQEEEFYGENDGFQTRDNNIDDSGSCREEEEEDKHFVDDNPLKNEFGGDQPIYEGSRLSISISIMLILTFVMRHHLTGVAVDDLVSLIEAHMIIPNLSKTTMKLIRRFFSKIREKVVFHYFCKSCLAYIGLEDKDCCPTCSKKTNANPYFIVIPLLDNLQSLFNYKGFLNDLSYSITRKKKNPENIEDIIDGDIYLKHFSKDGFLHGTSDTNKANEIHISLQCNTDGVSLFKSSKVEIWPIYYTINELSPNLRYRRKYRLFAGLWFSDKKPDLKTFLKPFVEELKEFSLKGKTVMTEHGKKLLKVFLFSGIFDAPAKSMFQNIVQFNGLYGCSYCLEPGETCKTGKGHVHAFPFNFEAKTKSGHTTLRSHNETIKQATKAQSKAVETGQIVPEKGVKGLSWSMIIPCFDIVNGLGLDYLHNTMLGVVKMLMKLWFHKKYKDMPWYIGNSVSKIDSNIKELMLPNLVSRIPRNIEHDFKHFKASEFRTFLLFYSAPILYVFLPEEYFQHYITLVEAVYLLLKDSISQVDLQNADKMLKHFCCKISRLYGDRYQTYNIHNLLHMVHSVKLHGPLWAQSAFWYEDYNGDYKHLYHGTQNVNIQIVTNAIIQHKIPDIVSSLTQGTVAYELYNKMTVKYHQNTQQLGECIAPGIYLVGNQTAAKCCEIVESLLLHLYSTTKAYSFKRICFYGTIIQSQSYRRVFKRNTHTIKYIGQFGTSFGFIKEFLCLSDSNPKRFLAVVEVPELLAATMSVDPVAKLSHMIPISTKKMTYDICDITNIKEICCYIKSGHEKDFIIPFPNRIEKD